MANEELRYFYLNNRRRLLTEGRVLTELARWESDLN